MATQLGQKSKWDRAKMYLRDMKRDGALYLMLVPGVLLLLLLNYLPMFGVLIAFKDMKFYTANFMLNFIKSAWVGIDNFRFLFETPDAYLITRNTLGYNLVFILFGNFLAVAFAISLNEIRNKRALKLYQSSMLLPYFLSWTVVSYIVYGILNPEFGMLNREILQPIGLEPVMWYSHTAYWPFILLLCNTLKYTGYNTIIYLGSLTSISPEYYEAAEIDGATRFQQIRKITIPLLSNMIIVMILLNLGRIFNADFGLFYQVPMESPALFNVTNVIDSYVFRALRQTGDIGMSSAVNFYQSFMGFLLVFLTNWMVRKYDSEKSMF